MAYEVEIELVAAKAIERLDRGVQRRIVAKIRTLATDPRPAGAIKMSGLGSWRVRVGDYRIVYLIDDTIHVVNVTKIGHRRDIYRGL